jgi:Icc protein
MTFSFIQITDHHLRESEATLTQGYSTAYALRAVLRHIAENRAVQADFLVSTGDLVDLASDASYSTLRQVLGLRLVADQPPGPHRAAGEGLPNLPIYFLPGNHDDRQVFYRQLFPGATPGALMNAVFEHQGIQFVCIDWGPQDQAIARPVMLDFLHEALNRNQPSILLMHHHAVPVGSRLLDWMIADEVARFWEVVRDHNVLGIFHGHTHATTEFYVEGIPVWGLRSTALQIAMHDELLYCVQPLQYRFVTVHDRLVTTRLFEVPW